MLLNFDPGLVRLILRIYFNVAFIVLAVIGNQCVMYSAKLQILRNKSVNITKMTGWLGSFEPFLVLLSMRRLPAGWLGGLMIISVALSYASDIAVSALVKPVQVSARCPFETGLVAPTSQPLGKIPVNGSPYTVVSNAQLSSIANGGPIGIYSKVNEDRDFQAQPEDVAGNWVCDDLDQDQVYQLGTSEDDIMQDLISKGLLFNTTPISKSAAGNGSYNHFVILTSSEVDGALQPFEVGASVQLEALFSDTKTMKSFSCSMDAPTMDWVLGNLSSQSTLSEWILTFQGSMYNGTGTPAAPDVGARLEWVLNSMVMIGAGGNYLLSVAPPGSTQGCLARRAIIPNAVLAIFGVVTFILVMLPLYLAVLLLQYFRFSSSQRRDLKVAPNSLVDWMAQAARASLDGDENDAYEEVESTHLKQWEYGLRGAQGRPRLFRKADETFTTLTGDGADQSIGLMDVRDRRVPA